MNVALLDSLPRYVGFLCRQIGAGWSRTVELEWLGVGAVQREVNKMLSKQVEGDKRSVCILSMELWGATISLLSVFAWPVSLFASIALANLPSIAKRIHCLTWVYIGVGEVSSVVLDTVLQVTRRT